MKSSEIISSIAAAIMPPESERIRGKNSSLRIKKLEPILGPYRSAWTRDFLSACSIGVPQDSPRDVWAGEMDRLCEENKEVFNRATEDRYDIFLYKEDKPTLTVRLCGSDKQSWPELDYAGGTFRWASGTAAFTTLMDNIHRLPLRAQAEAIRDHFRECLPLELQDSFISAGLSEGCCHSVWGDGSSTYGTEVRLSFDGSLDFVFAFINDLFRDDLFDDISITLWRLRKIREKARGILPFVSIDGDDLGVELCSPVITEGSSCTEADLYELKKAFAREKDWYIELKDGCVQLHFTGVPFYSRDTYACITSGCGRSSWARVVNCSEEWDGILSTWSEFQSETVALISKSLPDERKPSEGSK